MTTARWPLCGIAVAAWLTGAPAFAQTAGTGPQTPDEIPTFASQLVDPDVADNESGHALEARPEVFVQTRFTQGLVEGASSDDTQRNFALTRLEMRWAGRVSDRIGVGVEVQLHPALNGAPEELINDAFVEFYATPALSLRAGHQAVRIRYPAIEQRP